MGIYVQETYVNLDTDTRYGESEIYESFSDNVGELFRAFRKENGRCVGKIYVDMPDGKIRATGWVFQKAKYEPLLRHPEGFRSLP